MTASAPRSTSTEKCSACRCLLDPSEGDDVTTGLCSACARHPDVRRGLSAVSPNERAKNAASAALPPRPFTPAERALIRNVHGSLPPERLLQILNERLVADLGNTIRPYTMDQLYAAIRELGGPHSSAGLDWAGLRNLLAEARNSGLLATITEQIIDDFCVVFSLNPKQALTLKDTILADEEDES